MDQDPATPGVQDKVYADNASFLGAVDMAAWDMAMACGSCHVGGGFVESDRNGQRLSIRALTDTTINAYMNYVSEDWDPATGLPNFSVKRAPWTYPVELDGNTSTTEWMPNVREMDCFFCHLEGYNNMMSSVIVQMGLLNAAPMAGSGLMDMATGGYNTAMVDANGTLLPWVLDRIKGTPPSDNCRQCHIPQSMATLADMMTNFLAAAPMSYNPANPMSLTGLEMPAYDFDAPWVDGTGPLYFNASDQNAIKKAMVPFPRSDFFKRGDIWDDASQEVHIGLGCAGCHMDTASLSPDMTQCDPGRGYGRLSGVRPSSRNTVKRCEHCHITGKNADGVPIQTFGAPDPTPAHKAAGLTALITTAVGVKDDGNGTPVEYTFPGSHLDVIDCTVCHNHKKSMAVRALDATSGNRYPTMIGFDLSKGMLGMFSAPDPWGMFGGELQEWTPLRTWWQNGDKTLPDGSINTAWRRKIYNINMITAVFWNNRDPSVDANGDGANATPTNFDPWIQRDLKAGMTFAASGFAPIPVGFGSDPAYASAYDANGTFTGAWDWVGVYGGNVIFTRPDQIAAYKAYRTSLGGKPWDGTELLYFGAPFQVTHNIADTSRFALGKRRADGSYGCSDCHAPGAGFFDGDYDMTGNGVNASKVGANMMMEPAADFEVTGYKGDLRTASELQTKDGAGADLPFEANVTCPDNDPRGCVQTTDMDRGEALYPHLAETDPAGFAAKRAYLTDNATMTAANYGIGIDPVAVIASINGIVPDANGTPIEVEVGQPVTLAADTTVNTAGTFTYSWISSDAAGEVLPGATVSKTFSTVGTWLVTLKVTDEEGKLSQVSQKVSAVAPAPAADISYVGTASGVQTIRFANLPAHTMLYIFWGDGLKSRVYDTTSPKDVDHDFRLYAKYDKGDHYEFKVTAYVYDGSTRVDVKQAVISIPKADNP
ncbi:PKD domain-containing protein [Dissulfurirhabdus thermomarina]|uniref:PKD domain-containing protein n=1 Tax=Dissulfurirhabdus thermomarina TaxID=1765737 RepID=A0A6N9TJJ4_DISTH|nr:PKD domain-containing protein [Dissulfurirhabdus thermomarina]NDY41425.1 PKD domain-containing protein [Dissulfurirhabdus thermomarina]NMX24413.1 PKD domain-containing protein [Dissulfurirhabdus thermomarina]